MRQTIEALEDVAMDNKPWELTGEALARSRPENSLLELGDVGVNYVARPPPTITEETTETIEDAIRRRILDQDFDDVSVTARARPHAHPRMLAECRLPLTHAHAQQVERRLPPAEDAEYRPKADLSEEKSPCAVF